MHLLVIGGTRFVGRHLTERALAHGHRVTLFHRGQTGAGLFPECEHVLGDRDGDLSALAGREWDAVLDMCGYFPRVVRASATALAGRCRRYVFISSISVYAEPLGLGLDEAAALVTLADPSVEEIRGDTYGGLKALCEQAVREVFGARALVVRPGLIVGPYDPTGRFTWWPRRIARGGEVLAPGDPGQGVQFIDARDLAAFLLEALERDLGGTFHATGPGSRLPIREFLDQARAAVGAAAEFVWVDETFLLARGVEPWQDLPVWVASADAGIAAVDVSRAVAAGLAFRPLADTVRDTLAWDRSLAAPLPASGNTPGLSPEREAELLSAWRARAR